MTIKQSAWRPIWFCVRLEGLYTRQCLPWLTAYISDGSHVHKPTIMMHDNVIKWKHFPRYWPFVRGIHRSPVNSPHKGQWRGALMFSLICVWINDSQSWGWWLETLLRSLWRHRNGLGPCKGRVVVPKWNIRESHSSYDSAFEFLMALQLESCHNANFVVTQSWHHENPQFSMGSLA